MARTSIDAPPPVLHANWSEGWLHLWAESGDRRAAASADHADHPFALAHAELASIADRLIPGPRELAWLSIRLPASEGVPLPSAKLAHASGIGLEDLPADAGLMPFRVPTIRVEPARVGPVLDAIEVDPLSEGADPGRPLLDATVAYFGAALRMARFFLAEQRFIPTLRQGAGELTGLWQPWLGDEPSAARGAALLRAMPASARAVADAAAHQPWTILEDFLTRVLDAEVRRRLTPESLAETVRERAAADPHVAWLTGLLDGRDRVPSGSGSRLELVKGVRRWIAGLEDRGSSASWRLCLKLIEPMDPSLDEAELDDAPWRLSFHLQAIEAPGVLLDASDIWLLQSDSASIEGRRVEAPQELLLGELGRASRVYPKLESALDDSEPEGIDLNTRHAYQFLRESMPILLEQGVGVIAPEWWDSPTFRIGARLTIGGQEPAPARAGSGDSDAPKLGLATLVDYMWQISIGGAVISLAEFERLAARRSPLLRINGQWVEVRPEDVKAAIEFMRANPGGRMTVGEAMRMAYATDTKSTGIPIVGLEASGWVGALLAGLGDHETLPVLEPPRGFVGTLRPYQLRGFSWLAFLERFGFGPCLADDMGLGKTIQVLALLAHEREVLRPGESPGAVPPSLLVVPMSVVGNWMHEAKRFTPGLRLLVHHGVERALGDAFVAKAAEVDVVVTTYALAHRDRELLGRVRWRRVVLDEAQAVKNPASKQAQAVRALFADHRLAITGTPVENRLAELWSIMDFLNPTYLGSSVEFRRRFGVPIERYRDQAKSGRLRAMVQPFILRRLKTDPLIVVDLPEKIESKEYGHLTPEQAELYESCVKRMLVDVDRAEGIHRRGLVLAALIRLKQACNHPSQMLKDHDFDSPKPPDPSRSGKCVRLLEMMDEVLASGQQALIFTQFRQMGHLLAPMLRHELDREVLFLHGGTPQQQRVALVEQFQRGDGRTPILIVSLKAGGVGLNLTAATHVFHFDRWWNPAVENQATDRAHRIGQSRTVHVHKFVVRGTLEERIDEMIEHKTALAEQIIGSGERWLTELSTDQLRDLLTLRRDAVGVED